MTQEASQPPEGGHGAETPSQAEHWLSETVAQDATIELDGREIPLAEHPGLAKYADAADMAKALLHAQSLVGRKTVGLVRPADDASPEDWERYQADLKRMTGVPDSPEGYGLDAPEGGDARLMDWFSGAAFELGLAPEQARGLAERYDGWLGEAARQLGEQREGMRRDTLRQLSARWGGDAATNLELARRGFARVADRAGIGADDQQMLLAAHGDDPVMIRLFHGVGTAFAEDGFVDGAPGPGASREMSPQRFFAEEVFGGQGE